MRGALKSLLLGVLTGIVEYYISLVFSFIPYYSTFFARYRPFIVILFITGAIVAVAVLLYKNNSVCQALLRWACVLCSFIGTLLINAYCGTIHFLHELFNITIHSATENVSGMLSLSFFLVIQVACLVAVAIACVLKLNNVLRKTGAGDMSPTDPES